MMKIPSSMRCLAVAAAAALGLTATVQAGPTLTPTGYANGSENFHVVVGSPALNEDVAAGAFIGAQVGLLPGPGTILFWCYELNQYFGFNNTYNDYVASTVTPPAAATALAELFTEVGGPGAAIATTDNSAAFQLAVWEIKYDTGNGPYELGSGNFQVTGGSATTISLAQGWLDHLAAFQPPKYDVTLLASPSAQDFVTATPTPLRSVPEPTPLPLFAAGLAALTVVLYRRSSTTL